jgi:hypothetical protein
VFCVLVFSLKRWFFSLSSFVIPSNCLIWDNKINGFHMVTFHVFKICKIQNLSFIVYCRNQISSFGEKDESI